MSETDKKIIHVSLSIEADRDLSQAKVEALLNELQEEMNKLKAGPVELIRNQVSDENRSKAEPFITIAVDVKPAGGTWQM